VVPKFGSRYRGLPGRGVRSSVSKRALGFSSVRAGSRSEGSSLGSLTSACAVGQHQAVASIRAERERPVAVPEARVGMPFALFGRLVISWE
jgi:hypothetical protein